MDVLNEGFDDTQMAIEINTPSKEARRHFALPARRWTRITLLTENMDPELANIEFVESITITVFKQEKPLNIYFDNMMLLKAGETMPAPSESFIAEMISWSKKAMDDLERKHSERCAAFTNPHDSYIAKLSSSTALEELQNIRRVLNKSDISVETLASLGERIDKVLSFAGSRKVDC